MPLQTIYDQFNFGNPEPIAIQRFIAYAFQHWNKPPKFLLLVGDASYDSIGYQAPVEKNRLPSFLIQTISGGQTASDLPFGILNIQDKSQIYSQKSLAPALAIGRIPAKNASQVSILVKKILAYENLNDAKKLPNSKSIVAVADGQGESFRSDAQKFLNQFNQTYSKQLYAPLPGTIGAEQEITGLFANEHLILAYFGHGSIQMWGKDALFTVDGIKGLTKKSVIPYVLNFTCLTGLFNHPQVESIAEALLWKEDGGAIVVVAPTSLTLPVDQSQLSVALAQNLDNKNFQTIGEAFWDSQMSMTMKIPSERDVILTYLLFGDPALRLPLR